MSGSSSNCTSYVNLLYMNYLQDHCYNCGQPFLKVGRSNEHIIPDAVGGKPLTSSDLLCEPCNNGWGSRIDQGLTNQLGWLADFIGVPRAHQNKEKRIEVQSESGAVTWIYAGGKKAWELKFPLSTGNLLVFEGKTKAVVIDKAKKIQKQLIQKDSNISSVDIENDTKWTDTFNETVYFGNHLENGRRMTKVGGMDFYRAITKTLVGFAISNGVPTDEVETPMLFLKEGKVIDHFVQPYFARIEPSSSNQFSHYLYLKGESSNHLLIAYVELFNTYGFIALLNSNYHGPDLEVARSIDLQGGRLGNPKIEIDLSFDRKHSIPYWPNSNLRFWAMKKDGELEDRFDALQRKLQMLQIEREQRGMAEFH